MHEIHSTYNYSVMVRIKSTCIMAIFDKLLQWLVIPLKQKDNKNVCFLTAAENPMLT